jgi:hypothetical protein
MDKEIAYTKRLALMIISSDRIRCLSEPVNSKAGERKGKFSLIKRHAEHQLSDRLVRSFESRASQWTSQIANSIRLFILLLNNEIISARIVMFLIRLESRLDLSPSLPHLNLPSKCVEDRNLTIINCYMS